jgi:hypothetical protein
MGGVSVRSTLAVPWAAVAAPGLLVGHSVTPWGPDVNPPTAAGRRERLRRAAGPQLRVQALQGVQVRRVSRMARTICPQLRVQALQGVQATLEAALREEVAAYRDHLRASARAAARTPSPFRCAGCYHRRVLTSYGLIPDLRVPKLRSGNALRP